MATTAILNIILALGVIVMVVAPLVWAIRTQHRDHAVLTADAAVTETVTTGTAHRPYTGIERRRRPRPHYKPVVG